MKKRKVSAQNLSDEFVTETEPNHCGVVFIMEIQGYL